MFGCDEVVGTAEIAPVGAVGAEAEDGFVAFCEAHVGIDDGKCAILVEFREDARRDDVNAGESQGGK